MAKKVNNEWVTVNKYASVKGNADKFSLNWCGAVIHNCRIVEGKNGAFIGFPSFKGREGNYIKTAYVYCDTPAMENALEQVVEYFEE